MAKLTHEKELIEKKLAQPDAYDGNSEKLTRMQIELGRIDKKINKAEQTWLEAEARVEDSTI